MTGEPLNQGVPQYLETVGIDKIASLVRRGSSSMISMESTSKRRESGGGDDSVAISTRDTNASVSISGTQTNDGGRRKEAGSTADGASAEQTAELKRGLTRVALLAKSGGPTKSSPGADDDEDNDNDDGGGAAGAAADSAAPTVVIDAKNFKRTLQQVERGHDVCCSVFYSLLFTVLFVLVVITHLQPAQTFQVEGTVAAEYNFDDITDIPTFWTWVTETMVPVSFKQYDIVGDPLDPSDWSRIATYNSLVAGVRLRTWRAPATDCPDEGMTPLYGQDMCYPRVGAGSYSTKDFGLPACDYTVDDSGVGCYNESLYSNIVATGDQEGFRVHAGGEAFEFFLDKYDRVSASVTRVEYAEARHWLDQATVKTEVDILTYNGELDMFCLLQMELSFERGGSIVTKTKVSSAYAQTYPEPSYYVWDVLFAAAVLVKLVLELIELWPYARSRNIVGYFRDGEDGLWNLVDWGALILCVLLIAFWVKYALEIRNVSKKLMDLGDQNLHISEQITINRGFLNSAYYQTYLTEINQADDELSTAVNTKDIVRYLAAFNSFMIIVRFFKVARFLPRANLLVKTVAIAFVDLVHYAAVFLFVLVGFAIEAWVVFGHRIAELGTLWKATQTSMLVVMGAVDTTQLYLDMMAVSEVVTVLWYWGFFFIMILLVMNLLIAIIIDAYAAARGSIKDRDNLMGEMKHIGRILTLYWRPGYRRPRDLLLCFAPGGSLHGCDTITAELLVERVEAPGAAPWLRRILRCFCFWRARNTTRERPSFRRWKPASSAAPTRANSSAAKSFDLSSPLASSGGGGGAVVSNPVLGSFGGYGGAASSGDRIDGDMLLAFRSADGGGADAASGTSRTGGGGGGGGGNGDNDGGGGGGAKQRPSFGMRFRRSAATAAAEEERAGQEAPKRGLRGHCDDDDEEDAVPHLDPAFAAFLIGDACDDKLETDEAHGMTLSDAAKEISDALIRVKVMGDRFSNVENMLAELIAAQPSRAGTPRRDLRLRLEVPEPPLTRRAMGRMAAMLAEMEEEQAAVAAAAVTFADGTDGRAHPSR